MAAFTCTLIPIVKLIQYGSRVRFKELSDELTSIDLIGLDQKI